MENTLIKFEKINPSEYGLDEQKGNEVESNFTPIIIETENLIQHYQAKILKKPLSLFNQDLKGLKSGQVVK